MRQNKMIRPLAVLMALVMALTLAPTALAVEIKCAKCGQTGGTRTVIQEATCSQRALYSYVCTNPQCVMYNISQLITGDFDSGKHEMVYTPNADDLTHSGACRVHTNITEGPERHSFVNGVCEKCGAPNYTQVEMSLPDRRTAPIALGDASSKLSAGNIKMTLGSADITADYDLSYIWFYQGAQVSIGEEYALPASVYGREGVYYYALVVSAVPKGNLHRQSMTKTCNITVQVEELVSASAAVTTQDAPLRLGSSDGWSNEPISSQIYAQVLSVCGKDATPSHVRFNELPNSGTGRLSVTATSANYYFSGTDSLLDNVEFTPGDTAGEFQATFTAFDTAGKTYAGVLTITVQQFTGSMDVVYVTPRTSAVTLSAKDFQAFWERISPSGSLDYITFGELPTTVEGALYAGYTSAALPGDKLWLSDMLYVQPGRGQYGIDSVAFVPGVTQEGYVTLGFTAHGTRDNRSVSRDGVMYIFLTDTGRSGDVTVPAAAGGTALTAAAFQRAYQTATGAAGSGFYIQLMEVPASGSLYVGRTSGRQGTRLTAANLRGRSFSCGGTQGETVSSLTYVPGAAVKETVRYVASSAQGTPLYAGTITFTSAGAVTPTGMTVKYNAPAAGVYFKSVDFENLPGAGANKLSMVSFTPPAAAVGTLYYGRTSTAAGTAITSENSWFSVSASAIAGANSMNNICFVPAAGSSGTVSIPFTAIDTSAARSSGVVQITILSSGTGSDPGTTTPKPVKTFPDVPKTEWYYTYVTDLATSGVLGGYEDGTFRPSEGVSLGQALKMIMIAAGYDDISGKGSDWAKPFLEKAKADNLLPAGTPENLNRLVDRYTIAEIAARAMHLTPVAVTASPFSDMASTHKSAPYVMALYQTSVIEGSVDSKTNAKVYQGTMGIRRKEFAAIIWRMQNYVQTGNVNGSTAG